jgi:hypothetical protein
LDVAQRDPGIQRGSDERVPELMGRDGLADPGPPGGLADDPPGAVLVQPPPVRGQNTGPPVRSPMARSIARAGAAPDAPPETLKIRTESWAIEQVLAAGSSPDWSA